MKSTFVYFKKDLFGLLQKLLKRCRLVSLAVMYATQCLQIKYIGGQVQKTRSTLKIFVDWVYSTGGKSKQISQGELNTFMRLTVNNILPTHKNMTHPPPPTSEGPLPSGRFGRNSKLLTPTGIVHIFRFKAISVIYIHGRVHLLSGHVHLNRTAWETSFLWKFCKRLNIFLKVPFVWGYINYNIQSVASWLILVQSINIVKNK